MTGQLAGIFANKEIKKIGIAVFDDLKDLKKLRSEFLGKKGCVSLMLIEMRSLSDDQKPQAGKHINEFKKSYERIVKTAMLNTGGSRFVSKNPPNTGRIKMLLEIFPKAKFIFIYRNPYNVFLSNKKFLVEMMPSLQLEQVGERKLEEIILWTYRQIIDQYYEDKHLIPAGNLAEIRFEEFELNPLGELEKIYSKLGLSDFDRANKHFGKYANKQKRYKKNKHNISERELKAIQKEWKFTLDKWEYEIPDNLRITPDIEVVSR